MTNNHSFNSSDFEDKSLSSSYVAWLMLPALLTIVIAAIKFAESRNQLNYADRSARIIAGFLNFMVNTLHTTRDDFAINPDAKLIAIGPHRTGWEAVIIASKMKGFPPQFLATDKYNSIPGVTTFMRMFKAITVDNKNKSTALNAASEALDAQGCVALFPQGGFSKLGQDPRMVYGGAAKLALKHKIPIEVIRLDGFWSLQNPLIPLFIRNNDYYRAFLSSLHLNNIRATACVSIDFHLKSENDELSDEQKIEEINAQLYAYYRDTQDLTANQIELIQQNIADKNHLPVWRNKVSQDKLQKELNKLKEEEKTIVLGISDKTKLIFWQNKIEQASPRLIAEKGISNPI